MGRRRPAITLGVLTFAGAITAGIAQALPEPTDPVAFWMFDWLQVYNAVLSPWLAMFVEFWTYFFFSAIWYFFIAAVIVRFKFRVTKSVAAAMLFFPIVWLLGWMVSGQSLPIPMTYENGIIIMIWSLIIFGVTTGYLAIRLLRDETLRDEIELRPG